MHSSKTLALLVGIAASCIGSTLAQQTHFLTNMPESASGVVTSFVLPSYPNKKFPAGKLVDVVVGFRNEGSETYNMSMIAGSLNYAADFNMFVQNFTQMGYTEVLPPGGEVSLEYKFYPDPRLDPAQFIVALSGFYSDSKGKWYSTTFFNQTIDIVEVKKLVDWELLFLIVLFAAAIAGVVYWAYSSVMGMSGMKTQKRKSTKRVEGTPVMSAEDQQDWIKGTPYDQFMTTRSKAKKAAAKAE